MNNLRLRPTLDIGMLAYWFLPMVGAVYAAGFLVVFTFSKDYGINGTELLEARYIHVGSLFFMACLGCLLPLFWILFGLLRIQSLLGDYKQPTKGSPDKTDPQNPNEGVTAKGDRPSKKPNFLAAFLGFITLSHSEWVPRLPGTITYAVMILTFYTVLAFTERSFFLNHSGRILANFFPPLGISLAALIQGLWTRKKAISDQTDAFLTVRGVDLFMAILQMGIAIASVYFAYRTVFEDDLPQKLKVMFWREGGPTGAFGFVLFMLLIALYVFFAAQRFRRPNSSLTSRMALTFSCVCVVGTLSYMSVLTFAYAIYPYIPSSRGGGEFIDSVRIKLVPKKDDTPQLPDDIRALILSDQSPFIILDQNSDLIFVASSEDSGGPIAWRTPNDKNEVRRPTVYEIRRSALISVIYLNPKTK
jgi:hypothetical protein